MKYSPNPNSECSWFGRGCASIGGAMAVAIVQIVPIQPWLFGTILLVMGVFSVCMSVAVKDREP